MFKKSMFLLVVLGLTFLLTGCSIGPYGDAYLAVDWDYNIRIYLTAGSIWYAYDPAQSTISRNVYYKVKKGNYYGDYEAYSGYDWNKWSYNITITVHSGTVGFLTPGEKGMDSEFYLYLSWYDGPSFEQVKSLQDAKGVKDIKEGMETYSKKTIGTYTIEVRGKLIRVSSK
jgi:major membrane immunogen (membrane-anchored lipoprotein)